ncbi:MAG: hypothetical protein IK113_03495 [Bacteroidales bacterium]|nr:hypothetical protein [Bacteroidales bacterium]
MTRILPYLTLVLFCLTACKTERADLPSYASSATFDDTLYCFNQRYIVHLDGKAGIIDDSGKVCLKPEWDSAEFLDDEVALLSRGGVFYLCTKDGRVFAESSSVLELIGNADDLLLHAMDEDVRHWDSVLDALEELCDVCLSSRSRKINDNILIAHQALQEKLQGASGSMTTIQQERLEEIVTRFQTFYRK